MSGTTWGRPSAPFILSTSPIVALAPRVGMAENALNTGYLGQKMGLGLQSSALLFLFLSRSLREPEECRRDKGCWAGS
jgi:hypothetical protein